MFEFIMKVLIGLLSSIVNASNRTKRVFLSNQKCSRLKGALIIIDLSSDLSY